MRAIGSMSAMSVRAAQLAEIGSLRVHDLARERERVRARARTRAGKPDVRGGDAELRHQVEERLLVVDGGIGDRRRLQTVAQRLVVELYAARLPREGGRAPVPVVDELVFLHVNPNLTEREGADSSRRARDDADGMWLASSRHANAERASATCAVASLAAIKGDGTLARSPRALGCAPSCRMRAQRSPRETPKRSTRRSRSPRSPRPRARRASAAIGSPRVSARSRSRTCGAMRPATSRARARARKMWRRW